MTDHRPSRTAAFMAAFRALEAVRRPKSSRLFEATPSLAFLAGPHRLIVALARVPLLRTAILGVIDGRWPGVRTSALGRTCWLDRALRDALAAGPRQVVILGAGYDDRAWRLPELAGLRVFEVDHPTVSATKQRLAARLPPPAASLTFVPLDLAGGDAFVASVAAAGFDASAPAVVLLEGVLHYLDAAAVDRLFGLVAQLAPGSTCLFTYIDRAVLDGTWRVDGAVPSTLRASDESWTFGFAPNELRGWLAERGLDLLADDDADTYRRRYLGDDPRVLKGFGFYHAAAAKVR